jgi:hypothetical protein
LFRNASDFSSAVVAGKAPLPTRIWTPSPASAYLRNAYARALLLPAFGIASELPPFSVLTDQNRHIRSVFT